jgi:hypothetical protein
MPLEEQLKRSPRIPEHCRRKYRIRERIVANLEGDKPYRQVFNPFDSDEAPVVATLSDDLCDIYYDVEKGRLRATKDSQAVSASVIWQGLKFCNINVKWGYFTQCVLPVQDTAYDRLVSFHWFLSQKCNWS